VPLIKKIRTMRVALATTTVSPTRSCDHFSCFWLGKVVCKRQKHHNKRRAISGFEIYWDAPGMANWTQNEGLRFFAYGAKKREPFVLTLSVRVRFSDAAPGHCVSVRV
jgi:hypothetical protein